MNRSPRPLDALNSHVGLIRAMGRPDSNALCEAMFERAAYTTPGVATRDVANKLNGATTIVVTDRMLDVVVERMAGVRFGDPLRPDDLLFPAGYVVFPRPIELPLVPKDYAPDTFPQHVTAAFDAGFWVPSSITSTVGALHGFAPDGGIMYVQSISPTLGARYRTQDIDVNAFDREMQQLLRAGIRHAPVYASGWAFGVSWDPAEREASYILTAAGEFERRFWLSLFRALKEEIFAPVRLRRQDRRPAQRLGLVPDVVVADLRRVKHRDEERLPTGEIVMWTHRWRVTGHVRTLHRGTPQERTTWVREYVKGPADRPIIEKDRVYRLSR